MERHEAQRVASETLTKELAEHGNPILTLDVVLRAAEVVSEAIGYPAICEHDEGMRIRTRIRVTGCGEPFYVDYDEDVIAPEFAG